MQFQKIPITQQPYQELTFEFQGVKIRITLRFNSVGQFWALDVYEPLTQKQICQGLSLICGVPLLMRTTQPYFLWCEDVSGADLDPMTITDLNNRCFLYIAEKPTE